MSERRTVVKKYAELSWDVEDVLTLRPKWGRGKAAEWLAANERHLRDRLVEVGWSVMEDLMVYDAV